MEREEAMHSSPRQDQRASSSSSYMKKNCRLCTAHGLTVNSVSHSCPFSECNCIKCPIIRKKRAVVAEQTRIRRTQKKLLQESISSPCSSSSSTDGQMGNRAYLCQRCQNHGLAISKKNHHGKCLFALCTCHKCLLWTNRTFHEEELKRNSDESINSGLITVPPSLLALPPTSSSVVNCLPLPSTSTLASLLSTPSSLPSLPSNTILSSQFVLDNSIPIVDASLLPPGYLEACIASSQVEYIQPTPIIFSSITQLQ